MGIIYVESGWLGTVFIAGYMHLYKEHFSYCDFI